MPGSWFRRDRVSEPEFIYDKTNPMEPTMTVYASGLIFIPTNKSLAYCDDQDGEMRYRMKTQVGFFGSYNFFTK